MTKIKIVYEIDICIGCGTCANVCENWEMIEVGGVPKSKPKLTKLDDVGCNKKAEELCPVNCIHVEET